MTLMEILGGMTVILFSTAILGVFAKLQNLTLQVAVILERIQALDVAKNTSDIASLLLRTQRLEDKCAVGMDGVERLNARVNRIEVDLAGTGCIR